MKPFLCVALALAFAFVARLDAQTATARSFRVVTTVGAISDLKFDRGPRDTVSLLIRSTLSDPILLSGARTVELYREIPPPPGSPPDAQPTRQTVVTLVFPESMRRAIAVVAPTSPTTYGAMVFDDDHDTHPAGTLKVFNLSAMNAALKVGREVRSIPAGQTALAPYPPGKTLIQLAVQRGDSWPIAMDKGRISRPNLRAYLFVFNYRHDPSLHDEGPPPPALVRFHTESVPSPEAKGLALLR